MALIIDVGETTAALRRVYFILVSSSDGMSPVTDKDGEQPEISVNGGAWTSDGIGPLVHTTANRYYAELAAGSVAAPCNIESRFQDADTLEAPGTVAQVRAPAGQGDRTVTVTCQTAGAVKLPNARVTLTNQAETATLAGPLVTDENGQAVFYLPDGTAARAIPVLAGASGGAVNFTVSGATAVSCVMALATSTPAEDPDYCNVEVWATTQGSAVPAAVFSVVALHSPVATDGGKAVIKGDDACTVDSESGYGYLTILRGAVVTLKLLSGDGELARRVTVPDAAAVNWVTLF